MNAVYEDRRFLSVRCRLVAGAALAGVLAAVGGCSSSSGEPGGEASVGESSPAVEPSEEPPVPELDGDYSWVEDICDYLDFTDLESIAEFDDEWHGVMPNPEVDTHVFMGCGGDLLGDGSLDRFTLHIDSHLSPELAVEVFDEDVERRSSLVTSEVELPSPWEEGIAGFGPHEGPERQLFEGYMRDSNMTLHVMFDIEKGEFAERADPQQDVIDVVWDLTEQARELLEA